MDSISETQTKECSRCCDAETDAHHEDYRRPLEVRWLCRLHHMHEHHPLDATA